jgi:putative CocE/NonD family hydrolase
MPVPPPVITAILFPNSFIVSSEARRHDARARYVARMALLTRLIERLAKLPPATHRLGRVERDLEIPMDDGVVLLADVHHPEGAEPAPTVLLRSPYGRHNFALAGEIYARRGFRTIIESCRGTFGSGGSFRPQFDDRADGLATLRWIERQPWFDGRLAMSGPSYLGYVQWAIADEAGAKLKALCPHITMSSLAAHWYAGGSFSLDDAIGWTALVSTQEHRFAGLGRLFGWPARRVARHVDALPLLSLDERILGQQVPFWRDFVTHAALDDPFWAPADHSKRLADVRAPVAMVSGWYDIFLPLQLADYRTLAAAGNPPFLAIGPWTHTSLPGMGEQLRDSLAWFAAHLRGDRSALRADPVRLYVMGADEWRGYPSWPPPGFTPMTWHLHAGGRLAPEAPAASEPDRYRYDPAAPTPIAGGTLLSSNSGRRDQRATEARADVLRYTSAPLERDVEVIGEVAADVFVSSSLDHFDVFVRLCEVDERGRSTNVCDGLQRVEPGRWKRDADGVLSVRVALWPTAQRFRRGHRIRVQVSSGAHPRFVRNLGTGEPLATATALRAAEQAIHHAPGRPSAILLPVQSGAERLPFGSAAR